MVVNNSVITHYERIGGEDGVRRLVNRFYDLMDTLPEAKDIRDFHQQDLSRARELLFEFLSGWLGGPPLFVQKHGHPRLRQRHFLIPIGIKERDQWLLCMYQAMQDVGVDDKVQEELRPAFFRTADHMRNQ
jgi:hemoglobin